jgi:hypothetical protein
MWCIESNEASSSGINSPVKHNQMRKIGSKMNETILGTASSKKMMSECISEELELEP